MLTEPQTAAMTGAPHRISIRSACDALATAVAAMTIANAARPARSARTTGNGPQRIARFASGISNLDMLKMRLAIFLYSHPVHNMPYVLNAIDNAQSSGEIKSLLDYILSKRGHRACKAGIAE